MKKLINRLFYLISKKCNHKHCEWIQTGYSYNAVEMSYKCQDCGEVLETDIWVD